MSVPTGDEEQQPHQDQDQTAGRPHPTYHHQPHATGAAPVSSNTSAIILTIVSGVSMLSMLQFNYLLFFFVGIPSLTFGIMALTTYSTDPDRSRRKARTGWIIFGINAGVALLAVIAASVALALSS